MHRQDGKTLRRINELVKEIERSPFEEMGKTEPWRCGLSGLSSHRIDQANRLVYEVAEDTVLFCSVQGPLRRVSLGLRSNLRSGPQCGARDFLREGILVAYIRKRCHDRATRRGIIQGRDDADA